MHLTQTMAGHLTITMADTPAMVIMAILAIMAILLTLILQALVAITTTEAMLLGEVLGLKLPLHLRKM